MDKLMQIRVFARVAERGGFSAAGRDLDLSQSAVSKAITALEEGLGSRLVNRSTRAVTLTEAGQTYYRHCRNILDELETAEAAVGVAQSRVGGSL
ncbi:MAG: LysR family transcriptional regulator, partial [Chromatiales bacterium]|nr:LysR family transcriptional regulator [Chromatiales bacterium]